MGPVITVSGPHGTGKSTYAKILATKFRLRYVSAGEFFRQIANERGLSLQELSRVAAEGPEIDRLVDDRTKAEAAKGNVVLEGQLAGWVVKDGADARIYLTAPEEVRMRRIARRDGVAPDEARKQTLEREEIQRDRYRRYYGIDIDDLSIYNLVIDTSKHSVQETSRKLNRDLSNLLRSRKH